MVSFVFFLLLFFISFISAKAEQLHTNIHVQRAKIALSPTEHFNQQGSYESPFLEFLMNLGGLSRARKTRCTVLCAMCPSLQLWCACGCRRFMRRTVVGRLCPSVCPVSKLCSANLKMATRCDSGNAAWRLRRPLLRSSTASYMKGKGPNPMGSVGGLQSYLSVMVELVLCGKTGCGL